MKDNEDIEDVKNDKIAARAAGEAADGFRLDPYFQHLNPPASAAEASGLEARLQAEGCTDALVIWEEEEILLDGYRRHPLCKKHGIRFKVRKVSLPDRDAAEAWIIDHQAARRNLTKEGLRYLRGKRYENEKKRQGGTGANQYAKTQSGQNDHSADKTLQIVAKDFKVSPSTIQRDQRFAAAVDRLAAFGEEVKSLVLSRDARLTRNDALRIAELEPKEQKQVVRQLIDKGALDKPWRKEKKKSKILLPTRSKDFVQGLLRILGRTEAAKIHEELGAALQAPEPPKEDKPKKKRGRPAKANKE